MSGVRRVILDEEELGQRMSVTDVERVQRELAPKDDLSAYAGQWVALRDGHVVASDPDAGKLLDNPAVQADDVVMFVPDTEGGYFL
jgi:hypothetical protein